MKKHVLFFFSVVALMGFLISCEEEVEPVYSCVDYDGNNYKTVVIGNQVWMAENLHSTHATDGGKVFLPSELTDWAIKDVEKRFILSNDTSYVSIYGFMYNYLAIENGKMAPRRWRIPTKDDWEALFAYVKSKKYAYEPTADADWVGKALASKTIWFESSVVGSVGNNMSLNNSSGFNALPGGYRSSIGEYFGEKERACFWTSTLDSETNRPLVVYLDNDELVFKADTFLSNEQGCYLRCVRDVK